jgi:type IV pilus assembly protein PilV
MRQEPKGQAGFTLIEALIAMVILAVGLVAIANLFITAAASNGIANKGSAATVQATEVLERLKAIPFTGFNGQAGGTVAGSPPACAAVCNEPSITTANCVVPGNFALCRFVNGVAPVVTRWQVQLAAQAPNNAGVVRPVAYFITVDSQAVGPFGGQLSRSRFSTLRVCTTAGC